MTDQRIKEAPILYSGEEVAQILGVTPVTIYSKLKQGKLKGYKVCNQWRISKEDLQAFIESGGK